jgi:hypothetical protein
MHKHNWAIRVDGDERTLEALLPMLSGLPAQLRHETMQNSEEGADLLRKLEAGLPWPSLTAHPGFIMRSEEFNVIDDDDEIRVRAEAVLRRAVSILNVFVGGHVSPTVGPIVCRREDGTYHGVQISLTAEISVISQGEADRLDRDRKRLQSEFAAKILRAATRVQRAAEALAFLNDEKPDWPAMYAAIEAVALELDGRGIQAKDFDAVADQGWCDKSEIRLFKRTANLFRHAQQWEAPSKPMRIEEAQWLTNSVVRQWLEDLAAG